MSINDGLFLESDDNCVVFGEKSSQARGNGVVDGLGWCNRWIGPGSLWTKSESLWASMSKVRGSYRGHWRWSESVSTGQAGSRWDWLRQSNWEDNIVKLREWQLNQFNRREGNIIEACERGSRSFSVRTSLWHQGKGDLGRLKERGGAIKCALNLCSEVSLLDLWDLNLVSHWIYGIWSSWIEVWREIEPQDPKTRRKYQLLDSDKQFFWR